jgi:fructose-1,6-bisphosphatase/inositol monophosphatase family enzyme
VKEFAAAISGNGPVINLKAMDAGASNDNEEMYWVIDPVVIKRELDSAAAVNTAVSYFKNGEPVIGLIYFPETKKAYFAEKNKGAFISDGNEKRKLTAVGNHRAGGNGIGFDEPGAREVLEHRAFQTSRYGNANLLITSLAEGSLQAVYHYGTYGVQELSAAKVILEESGCSFQPLSPIYSGGSTRAGEGYFASTIELKKNADLLVTGAHRSGSTWFGKMMSIPANMLYYNEPFNIIPSHEPNLAFPLWYYYLTESNEKEYLPALRKILNLNYDFFSSLQNYRRAVKEKKREDGFSFIDEMRDIKRSTQSVYGRKREFTTFKKNEGGRILLKDPIAFFSAPYLYRRLLIHPLILIRHPAAFTGSLKLKNWFHPFDHFLKQPELMDTYLKDYRSDIERLAKKNDSIIENATVLWNILYGTVEQYQAEFPQWTYIKHEDVSADPVEQFRLIYRDFGLQFDNDTERIITEHTKSKKSDTLVRDSKENIKAWKKRLTTEEITEIRKSTEAVCASFYTNDDW